MADKTTSELTAVSVGDLTAAADVYDDLKIPGEMQGEAVRVTGAQLKNYAVAAGVEASAVFADSVKAEASAATTAKENAAASAKAAASSATAADNEATAAAASAAKAASSSTFAQNALAGVEKAIEKIPSGSTVVINDLTTGGTTAALSAEMGKELNTKFKGYTYTSLSEIGLSDADLSPTDFTANVAAILAALPNSNIIFNPSRTSNLIDSLRGKLNEDLGLGINTAYPRMRLTRFGGSGVPAKIEAVVDNTGYTQIFTALVDASGTSTYLYPFIVSYDSSGFLKQSGGKLTGDLAIEKTVPRVILTHPTAEVDARFAVVNGEVVIQAKKTPEGTAARQIRLVPHEAAEEGGTSGTPIKNALRINSGESEASGNFYIYGDHNKPSGSYKGTGSAEEQTVDIGAYGNALLVWNNSGDKLAIVTPRGAICKTGTAISAIPQSECSYTAGVLRLATTSDFLNKSTYTYHYRAL